MSALTAHDVVGNCRAAFDAAERLGIPRVIEPRDMSMLAVPDKLAVMTYLYQLRAHFTGHQLQLEQIGNTADESSYVIGNYKSDKHLSAVKLDHLKQMQQQQNQHHQQHQPQLISALNDSGELAVLGYDDVVSGGGNVSPADKRDVKNMLLSGSKHLLGKVALRSPSKEKAAPVFAPSKPTVLMTRRELTDPFGSDEEEGADEGKQPESNGSVDATLQADHRSSVHREAGTGPSPSLDPVTTNVSLGPRETHKCSLFGWFVLQ